MIRNTNVSGFSRNWLAEKKLDLDKYHKRLEVERKQQLIVQDSDRKRALKMRDEIETEVRKEAARVRAEKRLKEKQARM